MTKLSRFRALCGAGLAAGVTALALTAAPAYAVSGNQWCLQSNNTHCFNAWNGGPFVKLYVGGSGGGSNSDFTLIQGGALGANVILRFSGTGTWADGQHCIVDASNDPNQTSTSLDVCNISTGNFGYGTLFTIVTSGCPNGWEAFHNNHWGGYLAPFSDTNGSPMILNGSKTCYLNFPAG